MNEQRRIGAAKTADASSKFATEWHAINWHKVQREVNRLQTRIVEAKKAGNLRKVRALQHILTRSISAAALAVKRVTENTGKKHSWYRRSTLEHATEKSRRYACHP